MAVGEKYTKITPVWPNDFILLVCLALEKVLIYVAYVVKGILILLVSTQHSLCGVIQFNANFQPGST